MAYTAFVNPQIPSGAGMPFEPVFVATFVAAYLLERSAADRIRRTTEGDSELVDRDEILLPDRQSAELAAATRRNVPSALNTLPLEHVDETLVHCLGIDAFNVERHQAAAQRRIAGDMDMDTIKSRQLGTQSGTELSIAGLGGVAEAVAVVVSDGIELRLDHAARPTKARRDCFMAVSVRIRCPAFRCEGRYLRTPQG